MAIAERFDTISVTAGAAVPIYRFVQCQSDGKFDPVGAARAALTASRRKPRRPTAICSPWR
jgi:hypothetical protein